MKKILKNIFKKTDFLFLGISTIIFILSFFTDKRIFNFDSLNKFNYGCLKIVYLILLTIIFQYFAKAKNGDYDVRRYIKYFIIYMIPVLIFLLLVWPGFWFGDDVINFTAYSIKGEFLYYLNYLSSVFYIIGYMMFPCTSGAIILLACCFGILFSYLIKNLKDLYNSKLIYLILIPFLMFHVMCYMFFANRPIMFGVFYAMLISILIIDYLKKSKLTFKKIFLLSFLTALVGFWRSEAIYLIIAVPIFIFITYKIKINYKNVFKIFGLILICFVLISIPQKIYDSKNTSSSPNSRNLPIFVSPLSVVVTQDLQGDNLDKTLADINRVLNIDSLKKYSSFTDTPCIWHEPYCINKYDEDDYNKFLKAYIQLIKDNPILFLNAKWQTFKVSTAINGDWFSTANLLKSNDDLIAGINGTSTILNYKIRVAIYSVLEGNTNFEWLNKIIHYSNSLLVPLLLICIIWLYSIINKKLLFFLLSSMLICHTIVLFITSPAAYFMYYFNVYFTGLILFFLILIDRYCINNYNIVEKNNGKKNVLFVVDEKMMGGVSVLLEDIINLIDKKNLEISILVLHNRGDMLNNIPSNVKIIYGSKYFKTIDLSLKQVLKTKNILLILNKLRLIFELKTGLIKYRISIERRKMNLEHYDYEIAFKDGFTAIFTAFSDSNVKYHWIQYDYSINNPNKRYDKIMRKSLEKFNRIIAVSEGIKNDFNNIYHMSSKTSVIENVIDTNRIIKASQIEISNNIKSNNFNIICVGRLVNFHKGFDRLIDVLGKLENESLLNNVNVNIYGDGPDKNFLEKKIKDYHLENKIFLRGRAKNPYVYYKNNDLFILPSRYEAFGLVIVEALTLGVPVLVTKNNATKKLVNSNIGMEVPNNEDGIYYGLKKILENQSLIKNWKKNLKSYSYNNSKKINQINNLFKK